ncbi:Hypothetical protein, putative [Bodo saltans]|uniref:Uncharacterized protein n=1 Tax=Bodo saltans TaxID=75058 RepID=A0A0S4JLB3_BODSA|nr:Hypothetical protein, putative [Bodo saltans]|eukprot:CUG89870.1 Hypothetical protein, putative [Bodo saltans]
MFHQHSTFVPQGAYQPQPHGQRASTPPLYHGSAVPPRSLPTTPSLMPSHHPPQTSAMQNGMPYYPPQTVAMRNAPAEPFLYNTFNSRPASPVKQQPVQAVPQSCQPGLTTTAAPRADAQRAGSMLPEGLHYNCNPSYATAVPFRHPSVFPQESAAPSSAYGGGSTSDHYSRGVSLAAPPVAMPAYGSAAPTATATLDIAHAAMAHYQQRLDERRFQEQKLAQEESALAAEEAALLSQLEQLTHERQKVDEEHSSLCRGWSQIFAQNQWYEETPDLDLTAEVTEVQYRCQAMQAHLDELRFTLEGHQTELRKYDGNDHIRERQRQSMRKLDECLEDMEKRRQGYRAIADSHFDAEAQRERGCRNYLVEIKGRAQDLETQLTSSGCLIPWAVAGMSSRASSVAPQQQKTSFEVQQQQRSSSSHASAAGGLAPLPVNSTGLRANNGKGGAVDSSTIPFRQRVVSFRGNSNDSTTATTTSRQFPQGDPTDVDIDGASFTVALDEESFYSKTGGNSQQDMDDLIGLNGGSFAMNLCDTKRRRADYALTAM